jgi:hypothetical protein
MKVTLKLSIAVAGAMVGACLVAAPASATEPVLTAEGAQAVSESGHIVDFYTELPTSPQRPLLRPRPCGVHSGQVRNPNRKPPRRAENHSCRADPPTRSAQ